jgi:glycosyltransferase involved in cell wall biosynthesis
MTSNNSPEISLITPMFNEGAEIRSNIERILVAMDELEKDWEYILIDDGSTDDSYKNAFNIIGNHPRCHVLHYQVNQGRGYALRQGFNVAKGKYVITTESDLSWGPKIIKEIYSQLVSSKSDLVVASVFHKGGGFKNVPTFRRLLSRTGNWFIRRCFESNLTQFSGMTRGYRREAIQSMHLEEKDKEVHLEIISKAEALGFSISEVPATIQWSKKRSKELGKNFSTLRYVIPHLLSSINQGSLKIFFFLSFLLFFIGMGLATFGTVNKFYFITEQPKPNIVNYGLILLLMSAVGSLFGSISVQLRYIRKSLVHLQSQIVVLSRNEKGKTEETSVRGEEQ